MKGMVWAKIIMKCVVKVINIKNWINIPIIIHWDCLHKGESSIIILTIIV